MHQISLFVFFFLIAKGVNGVKVSKRLGHANAKITLETYAYLIPNEIYLHSAEESHFYKCGMNE
ncbi:hypothetical protein [Lysinibacillus antri]|uniref:Tyr recombinase domain-containing protein n=1 Tax=Lysinibacillus antri TaxID=2498145 RepID=A0A3S0RWV3_9BACI|nr:hypothetical protein [Lysinibacillus antri]RUL55050.1 hypothetical protein EK386_04800 [Lysinibacillus antri]